MSRCMECDEKGTKGIHEDPRDPPLDEFPCLCDGCYVMALETVEENLEDMLTQVRGDLASMRASMK